MAIHIDIFTRLHERQLRRDAETLRREYENAGDAIGNSFDRGIIRAHRNLERSNERVVNSLEGVTRANDRIARSTDTVTISERQLGTATDQLSNAQTRSAIALRNLQAVRANAKSSATALANAQDRHTIALRAEEAALRAVRTQTDRTLGSQRDHAAAQRALAMAQRDHASSTRDVQSAQRELNSSFLNSAHNIREARATAGSFNEMVQDIGTNAMKTSRGIGTMGAPIALIGLIDLAKVAATASQSILMLPASIAAAVAGIGTLKIATAGFSDVIKDVGDPEKFAEGIQGLSPSMQQAALSIQAAVPEFTNLKNATQDAFWNGIGGIGGVIDQLVGEHLPRIQEMTTGIADSFNQMMTGVADELLSPTGVSDIQTTTDNITGMFENAAPAAREFSAAFIDIMTVGSDFLPGIGSGIADLAADFADFIREARDSGDLRIWIEEGIDAVKEIATELALLGESIYQIFAEDGPQNIQDFKDMMFSIREVTDVLGGDFSTLREDINEEFSLMTGAAAAVRDAFLDIPEATQTAVQGVINLVNNLAESVVQLLTWMVNRAIDAVNLLPGVDIPNYHADLNDIPNVKIDDWGGYQLPVDLQPRVGAPAGKTPYSNRNYEERSPTQRRPREQRPVPPRPPDKSGAGRKPAFDAPADQWSLASIPLGGFGHGVGGVALPPGFVIPDFTNAQAPADLGATTGNPTGPPPDENSIREWVAQNFGIPNSMGTGSWENASHPADKGLHGPGYAFDFHSDDKGQMANLANYIAQNLSGQTMELIYQGPGFNPNNLIKNGQYDPAAYSPNTLAGHDDHVHWATTGMPGGAGGANPEEAWRDQSKLIDAKNRVEKTRQRVLELEADNDASELDRIDARNDAAAAERDLIEAMMGLNQKQTKASRGFASGMDQIGASIDADFGISQGLSGIAENLTKFIANLAMAPMMGRLNAVSAVNGGGQGGLGFIGQHAAVSGIPGLLPPGYASPGYASGTTASPGGIYPSAGGPSAPTANALGIPMGLSPAPAPAGAWGPAPGPAVGGPSTQMPFGAMPGPAASTTYGGVDPYSNPEGGQIGLPGSPYISAAIGAAGAGANAMAPGAGTAAAIAAETSMKLINRTIAYGGQQVGNFMSGAIETLMPFGASDLANNNWLTRLVGAAAGADPAIPNVAGGDKGGQKQNGPLSPNQVATNPGKLGGQLGGGQTNNITYNNNGATEDRAGADLTYHLRAGYQGALV